MTLKQKSILISIITNIICVLAFVAILYGVTMVKFQEIENQRVQRNIHRISAILDDRFVQINDKLADWAVWDDTYQFMMDRNTAYTNSNLVQESFKNIGIDEALFINKKGSLIASIQVEDKSNKELDFPDDLYQHFTLGSTLSVFKNNTDHNQGIIKTEDCLVLFVVREVFHSDGSGDPEGMIVFAKHLDDGVLDSMKNMTQFDASIELWNSSNIPSDFQFVKTNYANGVRETVLILDDEHIAGYLVIEDILGKPQAIIRSDIGRDIFLQGKSNTVLLIWVLVAIVTLVAAANNWLVVNVVLKKISQISTDVDTLGQSNTKKARLSIGKTYDEVDTLRTNINSMLDKLSTEKHRGDSVIDLINAIVISLSVDKKVLSINPIGCKTLGYTQEEAVGKDWTKTFIPQASRTKVSQVFDSLISGDQGKYSYFDNEVLTKDGRTILVSWHNTLIKNSEGKVVSTLSLGEDITLEKKAEVKKEAYAKNLERMNRAMINRELKMIELKKELGKTKTDQA